MPGHDQLMVVYTAARRGTDWRGAATRALRQAATTLAPLARRTRRIAPTLTGLGLIDAGLFSWSQTAGLIGAGIALLLTHWAADGKPDR